MGEDAPWDAWHPLEVAQRLRGVDVPWCVAAGCALDLFRGKQTREHEDLEIAVPYDQIILTSPTGVPYLVPEIVLPFKAKHERPKDQADFAGVLPLLDPTRRTWLTAALGRVHPGHPWIGQLLAPTPA